MRAIRLGASALAAACVLGASACAGSPGGGAPTTTSTTVATTATTVPGPGTEPVCMRNTFGGNDLEYTGVTQRYTYVDTSGGTPVERWFGYNSVFYESGDGTCTGSESPGLSIAVLSNPALADLQAACLAEFNISVSGGTTPQTVDYYGWLDLGPTAWVC